MNASDIGWFAILGLAVGGGTYYAFPARDEAGLVALAQPADTAVERLRDRERVVEGTGMGSLTIEDAGERAGATLVRVTNAGDAGSVTCRVTISPVSAETSR